MVGRAVDFRSSSSDRWCTTRPIFAILMGSAYCSDTDLRVIRLGRIFRRTSLDELPQLWNVVRGEMSLIGPRPELAEGTSRYRPALFRRLDVRPGMTGWAVVHGRDNIVPRRPRRDLDTWYADHARLLQDLKEV